MLTQFAAERLAILERHEAGARVVSHYDFNNAYQYIISREETQLGWLQTALAEYAAPLPPPAATKAGRIRLKPAAMSARMRMVIEQAACRSGVVSREDFRLWGFTEAEIDTHALPAYRQAVASRPSLEQLLAV